MLEWNNVGQFSFRGGPPRMAIRPATITANYYDPNAPVRANRFQAPARPGGVVPQFVTIEALLDGKRIAYGSVTASNFSRTLTYLNDEVQKQLLRDTTARRFQVVDESIVQNMHVFALYEGGKSVGGNRLNADVINEALRLLGFAVRVGTEIWPSAPLNYSRFNARIYPGLRGPDALEWNGSNGVGQIRNIFNMDRFAVGPQRFQSPVRSTPRFGQFLYTFVSVNGVPFRKYAVSVTKRSQAQTYLSRNFPPAGDPSRGFSFRLADSGMSMSPVDGTQPSSWNEWRISYEGVQEALRLLGVPFNDWALTFPPRSPRFNARIYPGLRGVDDAPLEWNSLGASIQLVQGHRYMTRWLAELAPAVGCGDILSSAQQAITAASYQSTWPWQNLVASGAPGWGSPASMGSYPFATPGFCPIWLEGVWSAPTTAVMDSKNLPALPGFFSTDLYDATTGQQLVAVPTAPGPCNPTDLAFDPISGIFKCAGQVMPTNPAIPPSLPPVNVPPFQVPPNLPLPTQPPVNIGTQEKKEKSVVPWLIGGALLIGGGVLLAKAG